MFRRPRTVCMIARVLELGKAEDMPKFMNGHTADVVRARSQIATIGIPPPRVEDDAGIQRRLSNNP
jgi:hypothetical protein